MKNYRLPPERGAGPTTPFPQGPRGGPGGRVPGSPLWSAKITNWLGDIRREEVVSV